MAENNKPGGTPVFPFSCAYQFVQDDEESACTGFEAIPFIQYCNEQTSRDFVSGVSTQTERVNCLNDLVQDNAGERFLVEKNIEKMKTVSVQENQIFFSPVIKQKTSSQNGVKKERTPRTMKRMMEKHRENERVRHHTLNQSMKKVCQRVPGFVDDNKETKVVMMQRVITYICYLENTIINLSEELGIKLDLATGFRRLTSKMRKQRRASPRQEASPASRATNKKHPTRQHSHANSRSGRSKQGQSSNNEDIQDQRHLKISSPTIDSTTSDFRTYSSCGSESRPPGISTPSSVPPVLMSPTISAVDYKPLLPEEENFDSSSFIHQQTDVTSLFHLGDSDLDTVSSTLLCDDFDENNITLASPKSATFDLICSPGKYNTYTTILADKENIDGKLRGKMMKNECSRHRYNSWEMTDADMQSIPPEAVLQTKFVNSERISPQKHPSPYRLTNSRGRINSAPDLERETIERVVPSKGASGKNEKNIVSIRSPLQNISNIISVKDEQLEDGQHSDTVLSPGSGTFVTIKTENINEADEIRQISGFPFIWKFPESAVNRLQQKVEFDSEAMNTEADNRGFFAKDEKRSQKIDHRKTSWMNGFMMFSRMNRRRFISANPGVHTSNISKIMGQSWRNMTDDEQNPYKEKAKRYAAYMQSVYEDGSSEMFDFGSDFSLSSDDFTSEISSSPDVESYKSSQENVLL